MPVATIDTTPLSATEAASVEAAEARAWADLYAAAPAGFQNAAGIETAWVGGAMLIAWAATARRYFSRAIGLAVRQCFQALRGVDVRQRSGFRCERCHHIATNAAGAVSGSGARIGAPARFSNVSPGR